tara:strand:+ start:280 stop:501 length:222 start_codon:yes stop_codon:yes gene_type:complete
VKKNYFFEELIEIFELDEEQISEETTILLDSLSMLSTIAFLDENFDKRVSAEELRGITKVMDLIKLVGKENLS